MKQRIKLKESQLRDIIKECVVDCLDEAYNQLQYANLSGQADGALNTLGGKIKGMFNPKWKERKQRQRKKFADAATDSTFRNPHIASNKGIELTGTADPTHSYDYDRFWNEFDPENTKNRPFAIKRHQHNRVGDNLVNGPRHGEVVSDRTEYMDQIQNWRNKHKQSGKYTIKDREDDSDFLDTNYSLNKAFGVGRRAAQGKIKPKNKKFFGTGTQNALFKSDGEGNTYK